MSRNDTPRSSSVLFLNFSVKAPMTIANSTSAALLIVLTCATCPNAIGLALPKKVWVMSTVSIDSMGTEIVTAKKESIIAGTKSFRGDSGFVFSTADSN